MTTTTTKNKFFILALVIFYCLMATADKPILNIATGAFKSPDTESLTIGLSLEEEKVESGEPVFVKVKLKNVSQETIALEERKPEKDFRFDVRDASGNKVDKLRYLKVLPKEKSPSAKRIIPPGEQREYEVNLSRMFDLSIRAMGDLIRGKEYEIQAHKIISRPDEDDVGKLSSNKVNLKVVSDQQPEKDKIQWGAPKDGIALWLNIPEQDILAGMPVLAEVNIINLSGKTYNFSMDRYTYGPGFDFTVKDQNGKALEELTERTIMGSMITKKLPSGQQRIYKYKLNRFFDFSVTGKYYIQVSRKIRPKSYEKYQFSDWIILDEEPKEEIEWVTSKSNKETVRIIEAEHMKDIENQDQLPTINIDSLEIDTD